MDVRTGSSAFGVEQFEHGRFVHNTLIDGSFAYSPKAWNIVSFLDYSNDGSVINNIFYNSARDGGWVYSVDPESEAGFSGDYNLAFNQECGTSCSWRDPINGEPHVILNQDPYFVDYAGDDFHLQGNSPAVDSAGSLTTTVSPGSGTQITVQDRALGDLHAAVLIENKLCPSGCITHKDR